MKFRVFICVLTSSFFGYGRPIRAEEGTLKIKPAIIVSGFSKDTNGNSYRLISNDKQLAEFIDKYQIESILPYDKPFADGKTHLNVDFESYSIFAIVFEKGLNYPASVHEIEVRDTLCIKFTLGHKLIGVVDIPAKSHFLLVAIKKQAKEVTPLLGVRGLVEEPYKWIPIKNHAK